MTSSLNNILSNFPIFSARYLAQVTGKIISMSPVISNVTRLLTRYCYILIESRSAWDSVLKIDRPEEILNEINFWLQNVRFLNSRSLVNYSRSSVVIYSDASAIGAGAFTVELDSKIFQKTWNEVERLKSSTWREMRAIQLALLSFKNVFQGKMFNGLLITRTVLK